MVIVELQSVEGGQEIGKCISEHSAAWKLVDSFGDIFHKGIGHQGNRT